MLSGRSEVSSVVKAALNVELTKFMNCQDFFEDATRVWTSRSAMCAFLYRTAIDANFASTLYCNRCRYRVLLNPSFSPSSLTGKSIRLFLLLSVAL